ncbi:MULTISPECIES: DUF2877 domain-containing protein [Arthrobacter]|uniref:DUF2877 domain-containing protein n=2 Tax=Arthrobacter TaxID=1663 RepID=A0ABU9KHM0_9MICC|nr:DUF2877 domain-containing protein [Arthrobacter sp. YJM1]MDP5226589.1 DUF2877 domain-containing protein [Arthrobacter sp. YJM1]
MASRTATRAARALSSDTRLRRILQALAARSGGLSVHSVFTHVINFLTPDGRLVTFASGGLDDAPWTLRADLPDWAGFPVVAGESVRVTPSSVVLADGAVLLEGWRGAEPWEPSPLPAADDAGPPELLEALQDWIARHGVPGGMLAAVGANSFEAAVQARLGEASASLSEALIWYSKTGRADFLDPELLDRAILGLVGLGAGLTPSGDDHLCGVALVAARPGSRLSGVGGRLLAVLDAYPERTTDVSEATLREAAEGRARQSLLDLLAGLTAVVPGDVDPLEHLRPLLVQVLGIGRTSGTDILSGLLAGLRAEWALR